MKNIVTLTNEITVNESLNKLTAVWYFIRENWKGKIEFRNDTRSQFCSWFKFLRLYSQCLFVRIVFTILFEMKVLPRCIITFNRNIHGPGV